jgi:coatomer subunit gamma
MTVFSQFNCTNTLNDQLLEDVVMMMQPDVDECGLEQVASISSAKLEYNVTGVLYLAFQKLAADFPIGKLMVIKFDFDLTMYTNIDII